MVPAVLNLYVDKPFVQLDASISDITAQQKWMWTRIHNISLTRYMGKERDGGLQKLREELEAENSGVQIPAEIRWLGGQRFVPGSRKEGRGPLQ